MRDFILPVKVIYCFNSVLFFPPHLGKKKKKKKWILTMIIPEVGKLHRCMQRALGLSERVRYGRIK